MDDFAQPRPHLRVKTTTRWADLDRTGPLKGICGAGDRGREPMGYGSYTKAQRLAFVKSALGYRVAKPLA